MRVRRLGILLYAITLASCGTPAQQQHVRIMDRIETTAKLPEGWEGIANYYRYYAFDASVPGRNWVEAAFVLSDRPGREWVPYADLPIGSDQGCTVITVKYDIATDRVMLATCNGVA